MVAEPTVERSPRRGRTERSGTERSGTEHKGTSRSGAGRQGTARSGAARRSAERAGVREGVRGARRAATLWLDRPLTSFHLIVTCATLLTGLGLVMVLSASGVKEYASGGSAYSLFADQLMFAVLGAGAFYLALRVPIRWWRKVSFPFFVLCLVLLVLVLVPGLGTEVQGARRWFQVGPLSLQPSELMKVALALWGAHLLATRERVGMSLKTLMVPLVPMALITFMLVVAEPNLSTTIALAIILVALLWFGGLPVRLFGGVAASAVGAAAVLAISAGYRSNRVSAFLNPGDDPQGIGYQARQASFSLADGGFFGRGLGQSRAKWSYLPNAHNDFIFAIIGEELGFLGCVLVLALFALFVYTGLRIAVRSVDPFLRFLTATATAWILGQAVINIGYVVGLLPVTGLQLPLVSAGGSSLTITLLMFGILASAARHEPAAVAALSGGGPRMQVLPAVLRLPDPEPYHPVARRTTRNAVVRDAERHSQRTRGGTPPRRRSIR